MILVTGSTGLIGSEVLRRLSQAGLSARAAGVHHVVKVSAFAASDHSRAPIGRWHHQSILAIAAYQRAGGKTVTITSTIADLTGRPPRTVAEFVREHASSFRG